MRIGIYVPTAGSINGGAMVLYRYANMLAERGHEVHLAHAVFSPDPDLSVIQWADWFTFDDRVVHHVSRTSTWPSSEADLNFEPWDVDALIGPSVFFPATPNPVLLFQGSFYFAGDELLLEMDGPILCVSNYLRERCLAAGVAPDRLVYLPNAVDHDTFRPPPPGGGEQRRMQVAIASNRWVTKRTALAVEVLERVRERVPQLEVVAFGDEPSAPWLPSWFRYLHGPDHQELAEHVYRPSRLFLCTSVDEGFGLPSLEAMACGAALVTTDTGGSRDFARHDESALVYEPGDVEGLANGVEKVLVDDELWSRLSAAGVEVAAEFSWERSESLLEATLLEQVRGSGPTGPRDLRKVS